MVFSNKSAPERNEYPPDLGARSEVSVPDVRFGNFKEHLIMN